MNRMQDVKISDSSLIKSYINYFLSGDYNSAFNLLSENSQLDTKKFVADTINSLANMLSILQNYYKINVIDYLQDELDIFQDVINNYKFIGEYNSEVIYKIYNYVLYEDKHYMYINNTPSSGFLPTNTSYWVEIDLTGEIGSPSYGLNFQYDWQSDFNYYKYDVVYYNNCLWVAYKDNYNVIPDEQSVSNDSWEILIKFKISSIYINSQASFDTYNGLIWFQII